LDCQSNSWEAGGLTITRKWKRVFRNDCECKSLISNLTEFLNSCQDINVSMCSGIMFKNDDSVVE
jgi:hypothetical protein